MSPLDESRARMAGPEGLLADLPLRPIEAGDFSLPLAGSAPEAVSAEVPAAGLARRVTALAADAATILLIWAAAVLVAAVGAREAPSVAGLPWSAMFVLLLSFFATVPPLILFGKTVGMAVAGLAARPSTTGRRLAAGEAVRRWIGTVVTAATLGTPLIWTARSAEAPTPADRLSGRALVEDESQA